jgi:hypothetical protein
LPQIGTLGDIVFEVSDRTVQTFENFMQATSGRWAVHEPLKSKPRPEFLGQSQGEIEFTMRISAQLGKNPIEVKELVEKSVREGKRAPLMVGNRPISDGDWYIERCETTFIWTNNRGQTEFAEMVLTLKEYF